MVWRRNAAAFLAVRHVEKARAVGTIEAVEAMAIEIDKAGSLLGCRKDLGIDSAKAVKGGLTGRELFESDDNLLNVVAKLPVSADQFTIDVTQVGGFRHNCKKQAGRTGEGFDIPIICRRQHLDQRRE